MGIGKYIKQVRKEKGIKQKELAIKLNMPVSTLANYENDKREPNYDTIKRIANALGVHEALLFIDDTSAFTHLSMAQTVKDELLELFNSDDADLQNLASCMPIIATSINEGLNVCFKDNPNYKAALVELFESVSDLLDHTPHINNYNDNDVVNTILDLSKYIKYRSAQLYKKEPTYSE